MSYGKINTWCTYFCFQVTKNNLHKNYDINDSDYDKSLACKNPYFGRTYNPNAWDGWKEHNRKYQCSCEGRIEKSLRPGFPGDHPDDYFYDLKCSMPEGGLWWFKKFLPWNQTCQSTCEYLTYVFDHMSSSRTKPLDKKHCKNPWWNVWQE